MEQQYAFNGACKYVADSVDRCRQMAQFIKKRQAIEDEYAKSLRKPPGRLGLAHPAHDLMLLASRAGKLCKSISLAPFQEEKSSWFFSRAKKADPSEGGAHEDVSKTYGGSQFIPLTGSRPSARQQRGSIVLHRPS